MFTDIIKAFGLKLESDDVTEIQDGHIHTSYLIEADKKYILQKINNQVFLNVDHLMENIQLVLSTLNKSSEFYPQLVLTTDEKPYLNFEEEYWRLMTFVNDATTYLQCESEEYAYQAGRIAGNFHQDIQAQDPKKLNITIPEFLSLKFRLAQFEDALKKDPLKRAESVKSEIEFVHKRKELQKLCSPTSFTRVTHNDLKFNNVLFNYRSDHAICVVDYDTVMPGDMVYDFGDLVRSTTATALEDEADLFKVNFSLDFFQGLSQGFLEQVSDHLSDDEKEKLPFAGEYMTFIIGVRFLTDYLQGDTYFKTEYQDHNLVRALNQFKLLSDLERQRDQIKKCL